MALVNNSRPTETIFILFLLLGTALNCEASGSTDDKLLLKKSLNLFEEIQQHVAHDADGCGNSSANECVPVYDAKLTKLGFTKEMVTQTLQKMLDAEMGKSFRNIGTWDDFFHVHFLYSKIDGEEKVVALLFHTQENWEPPGKPIQDQKKAKFIDKTRRNVIYWIDGPKKGQIENGAQYDDKTNSTPNFQKFRDFGTVTPSMIDQKAFGFKLDYVKQDPYKPVLPPAEGMHFFRVVCSAFGTRYIGSSSIVRLKGNDGQEICLDVSRTFCSKDIPLDDRKQMGCSQDCAFMLPKKAFQIFGP